MPFIIVDTDESTILSTDIVRRHTPPSRRRRYQPEWPAARDSMFTRQAHPPAHGATALA